MTRQSQRDLHAQRPVRSDFARRSSAGGLNIKKVALLFIVLSAAIVGGYLASTYNGSDSQGQEETPTIKADMPIKERPDQPGGIDIPHQDVTVFEQLDNKWENGNTGKAGAEKLLPEPEEPKAVEAATPEQAITTVPQSAIEDATETVQPKVEEKLPPPISEAKTDIPNKTQSEEVKQPKVVSATPPAAKEKTADTTEVKKKASQPPVKKESKPTASDTESKKAEAALARLPKELFTNDSFVPPAPQPSSTTEIKNAETLATTEKGASTGIEKSLQLASSSDEASAQKEAQRLQSKYAGILGGVTLGVTRADLGTKGIYYRVTSPKIAESKAKAICADIIRQKGSCILIK